MTPTPRGADGLSTVPGPEDTHELSLLGRLTSLLQSAEPLDDLLEKILLGMAEGAGGARVRLFTLDHASRTLVCRMSVGEGEGEVFTGARIPLASSHEAVAVSARERNTEFADDGHGGGVAALPIMARGRVIGAFEVCSPAGAAALRSRLPWLAAFAAQAGLALEHARLDADSERHAADLERLRVSERRYREFIERSPDGIAETAMDGRILAVNDRVLRLLGYTREELMSLRAADLYVDPGQRERLLSDLREKGQVEGIEISFRRKDGSVGCVSVSGRLREDAGQQVLESILRDVTERFELDRQLRALTDAVNCSADAILSVNADGVITSWNLGAQNIFGYAAAEILGRPYSLLVPPDRVDEFHNIIAKRVDSDGRLQGFQTERLHREGRRIPVSVTVTRVAGNGGPGTGFSVVVRDITERRKEEQRRSLLSSITEQSPDAILSLDGEGRITSWNRGAETMFGYRDEEIVGSQWVLLAPAEREAEYHTVVEGDPEGSSAGARTADTLARTRDGRTVPVRLFASVLRGTDGNPVGWSVILRDLTEQRKLAEMSERLRDELFQRNRLEGIVGNSAAMDEVRDRVRRVARFNSSVLLLGHSGTGKEIVANAIHYNSPRREKPFIKVNCAAIPETLLESELFGIERNVATGVDGRIGRFELADGGTLFLDEIGDMSLPTQARILRVLQEREFERVGGKKVIRVDVRIIAATNKDLDAEIQARRFREDLYYRLNVIVISLPPLSQRREDIDPLIDHFLDRFARDNGLARKRLSLPARLVLNEYDWPGNVRELEHCIERAVVMSEGTEIGEADLPPGIQIWKEMGGTPGPAGKGSLSQILRQVERRAVLEALDRSGGVQARAARLLGISERSMWYRVKKLGLQSQTS